METCLKPSEPEGGGKQLERAEYVPEKRLTKTVTLDRAGMSEWATEAVRMMGCDDYLLSNSFDGWGDSCLQHLVLVSNHGRRRAPGTMCNKATDMARRNSAWSG